MYEALYRKWRPRVFADVVGQEHVTEVLKNQVRTGKLSHAYLFCGSRGTGKTTCARILAKAANCPHTAEGDPCGRCEICVGIDNDALIDVTEVDAASNNGVDYMRTLKEESVYTPTTCKYRVMIIDEAHMLSASAFNAFLKLLEEPPPHVLFILATTDAHKLPATILSRCQRYDFRRITASDIANRLSFIAKAEGIALTEGGASFLAGMADGALRNAISMLEQAASAVGSAPLDEKAASEALGIAESDAIFTVLDAVAEENGAAALDALARLYEAGNSMQAFMERLLVALRDVLTAKYAQGAPPIGSGYGEERLAACAAKFGKDQLLYVAQGVSECARELRASVNPRVDAELCVMRLCARTGRSGAGLAARVESLERKIAAGALSSAPSLSAQTGAAPSERGAPKKEEGERRAEKREPSAPVESAGVKREADSLAPRKEGQPISYRAELFQALKSTLGILEYTQLQTSALTEADGELIVACENDFSYSVIHKAEVTRILREGAAAATGREMRVTVLGPGSAPAPEEKKQAGGVDDAFEALLAFGEENGDIAEIE